MSTLASVVEGIERDVLAYTRLAEEARRVIEAATRPSRELAQAIRNATIVPRSVAQAAEEILRSAHEAAHLNRLAEGLSRPTVPEYATNFFADEWSQVEEPERARLPFGFHP
jgi:hypothetical protein